MRFISLEQKNAQKNNEGCEIRDKTAIGRYCSRRKRKRQENVLIGTEQREKAWLSVESLEKSENRRQSLHMVKRSPLIYAVESVKLQNKHSSRSNKHVLWQRPPQLRFPLRCHVGALNGVQSHS